jgi:plastocyanin
MDSTLFYVLGIALVATAIVVSFVGLRSERFPSGPLMTGTLLLFAVLVVATMTFAVLNAKDEQKKRQEKLAREEKKLGATPIPGGGEVPTPDAADLGAATPAPPASGAAPAGKPANQPQAKGPGGTLNLIASKTQLAFNTTKLSSKPGKVTLNLDNPAPIPHDIGVKKGSQLLAVSPQIAASKTSITVDLAPGTYEFLCTVPGHAQAGMQGTLTVK